MNVPSRKQRNQPSNRVHDIEFATEISTSLLAQVRHLQGVLAERDETLKSLDLEKSKLEADAQGFSQRLRNLNESEHRYKDENWNLETQTHELIAASKQSADREQRLQQALTAVTSEKSAAQRELDDVRQTHGKAVEDHTISRKNYDSELANLRRSLTSEENEKTVMQRKLDELVAQNKELARAVAVHSRGPEDNTARDIGSDPEDFPIDRSESEHSPPPSPSKGAIRHTMLESETLKSSLSHAHRMIQNLKGNIHREKTEKVELKRMLQEARDELEARRNDVGGVSLGNKRMGKKSQPDLAKKSARLGTLGVARNGTTDIVTDDPEWEDHDGERTPATSKTRVLGATTGLIPGGAAESSDHYLTANDTDAFETANEREGTENEAFQTGAESMAGDSSEEMTETEDKPARGGTIRAKRPSHIDTAKAGDRNSYISTASTSGDDESQEVKTPLQNNPQRYKLKVNRGSRRSRIGSEGPPSSNPGSSMKNSPASFISTNGQAGQSLFAELGDLNGEESGDEGTPSRSSIHSRSRASSRPSSRSGSLPASAKRGTADFAEPPVPKLPMVSSSTMTDPRDFNGHGPAILGNPVVTAPITPQTRDAAVQRTPASGAKLSKIQSITSSPQPVWDQPLESFAHNIPTFEPGFMGTPKSTASVSRNVQDSGNTILPSIEQDVGNHTQPTTITGSNLGFSPVRSVDTLPNNSPPAIPSRDTRRPTEQVSRTASAQNKSEDGPAESSRSSILGSVLGWGRSKRQSTPQAEPHVYEDEGSRDVAPTPVDHPGHQVLSNVPVNQAQGMQTQKALGAHMGPSAMADQSSQTLLSSDEIDRMVREKSEKPPLTLNTSGDQRRSAAPGMMMKPLSDIGATQPPTNLGRSDDVPRSTGGSPNNVGEIGEGNALLKTLRRPTSSASVKLANAAYPPLPPDHRQAIAAAAQKVPSPEDTAASMPPPGAPASAYRAMSIRPRTPSQQRPRPASRNSTATTTRGGPRYSTTRSQMSRRSSVSSFASELDERFNIRTEGMMMPQGFEGNTDPRMIQAITQTMIGEYLWKYTRKTGRGEMSENRHRRFFWVHPYTRTLYWSDRDPSTAGRAQLKAKSVAIEAVRVVTDDNPMPPGLHRKSLVIITPGRSVKFTATTGQRHETWFNALSYLLLRSGPNASAAGGANNDLTAEDVAEFNPSSRRMSRTGGSRLSLASYTQRNSIRRSSIQGSPQRADSRLSMRRTPTPTMGFNAGSTASRYSQQGVSSSDNFDNGKDSIGRRISSYWKPNRNSMSSQRTRTSVQDTSAVYRAPSAQGRESESRGLGGQQKGMVHDSAEDVRQVMDKQDKDSDRLENVRACCDGELPNLSSFYLFARY